MYVARFRSFLLVFALLANCGQAWPQSEEVHLAVFPKSAYQYVSAKILSDIYLKSGLTVKLERMPPPRATKEALAGRIDGEVSRVKSYGDDNPTLIRVTPAYNYFNMTAFSKLAVSIESPADLKKYRVGVVRGLQAAADITEGLENVEKAVNSENLFLMLEAGRFDIAIDVDVNGAIQVAMHSLKEVHPVGALLKADGFHYLAPNKAYLQPRIQATIAEMKRSGELEQLRRKYTREFVQRGVEPE